jgi:hypothetical protein
VANYTGNMSDDERASFDAAVANGAKASPKSGMPKSVSRANAYARSTLSAAADALNGFRTGNPPTKSEVRAIAAQASKGLPARMGDKLEQAVLRIADDMKDGFRPDEYIREASLDAANTAPEEFVDPDATDPNRDDLTPDEIADRVRR